MSKKVLAVACSDIHLSHKKPPFRAEEDWYGVMAEYIEQVREVCVKHNAPLLIAGDIFDRWNSPPELINFAIDMLRQMPIAIHTIPGQHDLPNHSLDRIGESAYETLIRAEVIEDIGNQWIVVDKNLAAVGVPWGCEIPKLTNVKAMVVAAVHRYVWMDKQTSYKDAPRENRVNHIWKELKGYNFAIFGDNHKGFTTSNGKTSLFNCGTLIRRKSDEAGYRPIIGLLCDDGVIRIRFLDTSKDQFLNPEEIVGQLEDGAIIAKEFIEELSRLGVTGLDFAEYVKRACTGRVGKFVRNIINEVMEEANG